MKKIITIALLSMLVLTSCRGSRKFGCPNHLAIEMLGYSANDLKIHIESLFRDGMSWENYGEWHIDHIKPLSSFENDEDISIVNCLENLQPLWAFENLSKSNKYND
jgi:hypothetical protein